MLVELKIGKKKTFTNTTLAFMNQLYFTRNGIQSTTNNGDGLTSSSVENNHSTDNNKKSSIQTESLLPMEEDQVQLSTPTICLIGRACIECPICLDLLCEHVTLLCGHTFCEHCIKQFIASHTLSKYVYVLNFCESSITHRSGMMCKL